MPFKQYKYTVRCADYGWQFGVLHVAIHGARQGTIRCQIRNTYAISPPGRQHSVVFFKRSYAQLQFS